jgi:hypothetical protein
VSEAILPSWSTASYHVRCDNFFRALDPWVKYELYSDAVAAIKPRPVPAAVSANAVVLSARESSAPIS